MFAPVAMLAKMPSATCYFNPNGELLLHPAELAESLAHAERHDLPPIDAWSNVRMFGIDAAWTMMDTVGLAQLDEPDHEAWFRRARYEPAAVARWLRNVSLYVHGGTKIEDGHTADGPGGIKWRASACGEAATAPPRDVLRWAPDDGGTPPWLPPPSPVH